MAEIIHVDFSNNKSRKEQLQQKIIDILAEGSCRTTGKPIDTKESAAEMFSRLDAIIQENLNKKIM